MVSMSSDYWHIFHILERVCAHSCQVATSSLKAPEGFLKTIQQTIFFCIVFYFVRVFPFCQQYCMLI